jgi:hypothetical protein
MATTKTRTKFDIRTEARKPLYAGVGVTDLAVEKVRDLVTETQTRLTSVQKTATSPKALREQAVTVVGSRVDALTKDAKAYRAAIEARVAELQTEAKGYPARVSSLVDENVNYAADAFIDLVERGESLVGRIRRQKSTKDTVTSARTTVAKVKTTNTQARKTSTAATKTAKTAVKKATDTAKKTNTKPATKKAAATKSSAKATVTTAKNTAENAVKAVSDAAQKIGD